MLRVRACTNKIVHADRPRDAALLAWRLLRAMFADARSSEERAVFDDPLTSLQFIMQYVDDVGAACMDDLLYGADGAPYYMRADALLERLVPCDAGDAGALHARRPDAHYHLALKVIEAFGHSSAAGKGEGAGREARPRGSAGGRGAPQRGAAARSRISPWCGCSGCWRSSCHTPAGGGHGAAPPRGR